MKKIFWTIVCVSMLASCGNRAKNEALKAQNDSLVVALAERDAQMNDILEAFNEVQEGFRQINEAENRVDLQAGAVEGYPFHNRKASIQSGTDCQVGRTIEKQPL